METNKKLTMEIIEKMFHFAKENKFKFVAVEIENSDYKKAEIIINPLDNFEDKFNYCSNAYNENLELKNCEKIKIKNVIFFNKIEDYFCRFY